MSEWIDKMWRRIRPPIEGLHDLISLELPPVKTGELAGMQEEVDRVKAQLEMYEAAIREKRLEEEQKARSVRRGKPTGYKRKESHV